MFSYSPLGEDEEELRVLTVLPSDHDQADEPIRCLLEHVSLQSFTEEYMTWERENGHDLNTHPQKARVAWLENVKLQEVLPNHKEDGSEDLEALTHERNFCRYTWGDYVALSYCWGSESHETSKHIVLNGYPLQVTENLHSALYFIRETDSISTTFGPRVKIWIDAICIQQTNQEEKIHEIRRMKTIYGGSLGVVVHLGPHLDDTDIAMDSLQLIAAEVSEYISQGESPPDMHRMENTETNRKMYIALGNLLCHPYWCRLWILQELAMSDTGSILGYGNRQFRFSDLILASKFYWHNVAQILTIVPLADLDLATLNNSNLVVMFTKELWNFSRRLEGGQPVTYTHLQLPLDLSRNGKSKLAQDKVFGLLAILPGAVGKYMEPFHDYTLAPEDIYVEFTKSIIATTGELGVICMRSLYQTMTPSWAVDWQFQPDRVDFHHNWCTYGYNGFRDAYPNVQEMIETGQSFRADRSWKGTPTTFEGSSILNCSGIRIGTVDGTASIVPSMQDVDQNSFAIVHDQSQHRNNPYGDEALIRSALVHTLCANPVWGDQEESCLFRIPWISERIYSAPQKYQEEPKWQEGKERMCQTGWSPLFSYVSYFTFEIVRRILGEYQVVGRPFRDWFDQEIVEMAMPQDRIFLDLAKMVGAQIGRKFATMDTGHFGLLPNTALRGDGVYVIPGCSFPVVLRPAAGTPHFKVIGECYIEGFMRGEAIDGLEEGKYELESISLC